MESKEKDKSLLELAAIVISEKKGAQSIISVAKEAMERKGLKTQQGKDALARFLADFMESGIFVYCGDGKWDLKERQATSVLERDNSNYSISSDFEEDAIANELKSEDYAEDEERVEEEDSGEEDEIEAELSEEERLDSLKKATEESGVEIEKIGGSKVRTGYEEDEGDDDELDDTDFEDENDMDVEEQSAMADLDD